MTSSLRPSSLTSAASGGTPPRPLMSKTWRRSVPRSAAARMPGPSLNCSSCLEDGSVKDLPVRIYKSQCDSTCDEKAADEQQRGVPVVMLLQPDHDQRAHDAANLPGGVHRCADNTSVAAADVDHGSPRGPQCEHAGGHRNGDAPRGKQGLRSHRGKDPREAG